MIHGRLLFAVVVMCALAAPVSAQVSLGGAQSLYIQPGARAAGMGDCFAAVADDASAAWWNAAGLAFMTADKSFTLLHTELMPDWGDIYYEFAGYAQRVEGLGTIGGSIIYLTYGDQPYTETTEEVLGFFKSFEIIPSLAYGTKIGDNLALGINLKFIYVHLAPAWATGGQGEGTGTTFAGDLGVLARAWDGRLRLGGNIQHVGPRIAYIDEEQSDPLPRNLKVGGAVDLVRDEYNRLMLTAEYNKSLIIIEQIQHLTHGVIWSVGAEYEYYDLLALRAGYYNDTMGSVWGLTFGMGIRYKKLSFDVASVPQAEGLKRPLRFSLTGYF